MREPVPSIPPLPPAINLGSAPLVKALKAASSAIAEVRKQAAAFPYQSILIDRLGLIDAMASCEMSGVKAGYQDVFVASLLAISRREGPAKEVLTHRATLKRGFDRLSYDNQTITTKTLVEMYRMLTDRHDAVRMMPGPVLRDQNGTMIHEPPGDALEIQAQIKALEQFLNEGSSGIDPLVRMAMILHQFESIQPFLEGNARLGRILASLFLVRSGMLEAPTLCLSHALNQNKTDYYALSKAVRDDGDWEDWILHILNAMTQSTETTLEVIAGIRIQLADYNQQIKDELPTVHSPGLIGSLFRHPYTRIEFLQNDIGISAKKATRCLNSLAEMGYLTKHQKDGFDYFVNDPLIALLNHSVSN